MTYDSNEKKEQRLVVHKDEGLAFIFRASKKELYYSDVAHDVRTILVNTVDINKSKYSIMQYSLARKAQNLQDIIGRSSTKDII